MRVLVTGANGFVASRLIPRLVADGHAVVAAVGAGGEDCSWLSGVERVETLDVTEDDSVQRVADTPADWIIHLAGFSSGGESRRNAARAYEINTVGTARIAEAVGCRPGAEHPARMLFASSGLVYGNSDAPLRETDPVAPCGPYAASKAAAEIALAEIGSRTGLEVIVARSFAHTGAGQDERFVIPAFARRIRNAFQDGSESVSVGNLDPVRDFLHVDDVVDAYLLLLEKGTPGGVYNVASGSGVTIGEMFRLIAEALDVRVTPEGDPSLVRKRETLHSVGDVTKLRSATGWCPRRTLRETVQEVVDAQAN